MSASIVVSLDFELRWGLFDILREDAAAYRRNLLGVREVVPRLLEAFTARGVRATWAVVGAVACSGWDEWYARAPSTPRYDDVALRWNDAYRKLDPTGELHFAPDLVERVVATPGQEIASHTFSHVYLREPGFSRDDAIADADAMVRLFEDRWGSPPRSIVFPRNQIGHVDVLRGRGIEAWRENPAQFYWGATSNAEKSRWIRALRFADSLLPMGRRGAPPSARRASYFVRAGLPKALWRAHRARVRADARRLADGDVLHLWWHPHNLGGAPAALVERVCTLLDEVQDAAPRARFRSMIDVERESALPS